MVWAGPESASGARAFRGKRALEKDILPALGAVRLADVTKAMVMDLLDAVVHRGARILANRLFGDLRQFFTFCVDREWMPAHPLTGITRAKVGGDETPRERALAEAEIRELHQRLPAAHLQRQTELALWIMLGTCCRVGELSLARWEQVGMESGEWLIPGANTKNGKEHIVYLSRFVKDQFDALRQITGTTEWCYPAGHRQGPICLKSISKQIRDRQRLTPLSNRTQQPGPCCCKAGNGRFTTCAAPAQR